MTQLEAGRELDALVGKAMGDSPFLHGGYRPYSRDESCNVLRMMDWLRQRVGLDGAVSLIQFGDGSFQAEFDPDDSDGLSCRGATGSLSLCRAVLKLAKQEGAE